MFWIADDLWWAYWVWFEVVLANVCGILDRWLKKAPSSPSHLESRSLTSVGESVRVIFVNRLRLGVLPVPLPKPSTASPFLPGIMGIPSLMYLFMMTLNTELLSYIYNIAAGIRAATIHIG